MQDARRSLLLKMYVDRSDYGELEREDDKDVE